MPPKPAPTHFLCIPLVTTTSRPQLVESLAAFRTDVTNPQSLGGFDVPDGAVRPVGTLHLTLGVMSFPQGEDLGKALELLKSLKPREILSAITPPALPGMPTQPTGPPSDGATAPEANRPANLSITLKGLHSMHQVEKTSILYAPPEDKLGTLQSFGEKIRKLFKEAGLMSEDTRPLLLHATIVNLIYVKGGRQKGAKGRGKWEKPVIDNAKGILDRYEDYVWMKDIPVEKIAICRMGAKPSLVNGVEDAAYEIEAEVDF